MPNHPEEYEEYEYEEMSWRIWMQSYLDSKNHAAETYNTHTHTNSYFTL